MYKISATTFADGNWYDEATGAALVAHRIGTELTRVGIGASEQIFARGSTWSRGQPNPSATSTGDHAQPSKTADHRWSAIRNEF